MKHANILKKVITALNTNLPNPGNDQVMLRVEDKAVEVSKQNFHKIEPVISDKKIAFIDGGNAELISAPNFSVHFIRLAYCIFQKNKRIQSRQQHFYVLATSSVKEGKIMYKCQIFQGKAVPDEADLVFEATDETLRHGLRHFSISKLGGIARRFAELRMATELCRELEPGSVIVLDGTLEAAVTNEKKYLDELFNAGLDRNVLVTSLAKTTGLLSDKANSFNAVLNELGPEGIWYYHPVTEIKASSYQADIYFVKLHQKSEHVFRFELFKKQQAGDVLGILAANSKDMVFPGYPYGLIITDRLARVSNREKEYLITQLSTVAADDFDKLKRYVNSTNAHHILDRIS